MKPIIAQSTRKYKTYKESCHGNYFSFMSSSNLLASAMFFMQPWDLIIVRFRGIPIPRSKQLACSNNRNFVLGG